MHRRAWTVRTSGRGFIELTPDLRALTAASRVAEGLCNVFLAHTSASLLLSENADPAVRRDLESYFSRLAPDADPRHEHAAEGSDDMPAHIRTILTQSSLTIPVAGGQLALGTWQGVYLWEHRHAPHPRRVIATIWGG